MYVPRNESNGCRAREEARVVRKDLRKTQESAGAQENAMDYLDFSQAARDCRLEAARSAAAARGLPRRTRAARQDDGGR